MSNRKALEVMQKIHEVVEHLERARDLKKLELMEVQIKIARLKAKQKALRRLLEGE
jgi:hypothetical protein